MKNAKITNKKRSNLKRSESNNQSLKNRFAIDFFEFSFLVEACIPPRPIARSMFWDKVINEYYYLLTPDERSRLHEWVGRNPGFDLKNEDCALFYARFNPANQYKVKTSFNGKEEERECFKWKNEYYIDKRTSIVADYIVDVVPVGFQKSLIMNKTTDEKN